MANTYLTKTYSTTASSKKILTVSAWVKRSKLGTTQEVFSASRASDGFQTDMIRFGSSDQLEFFSFPSTGGTTSVKTNRVFRDTNSWYNIVVQVNTTDGTAADRVRMYVNGVRETSFATGNYPAQNSDLQPIGIGSGTVHTIGAVGTSAYFDGSISHIHYCDGQALDATSFGETDTTTGEWKAKTSPSVTYGNNGFFILKDGNGITDQSGEGNDFTLGGGTLTDLKDNPDNVFATMNALSKGSSATLSKGNTIIRNDTGNDANVLGTIALGNGKYYWETYKHGGGNTGLGLTLASIDGSNHSAVHSYRVNYYADGYIYQNGFGLSDINTGVTYGDTDIIGVSVDTENGTIKFYKNGVLVNNSSQTNSAFTYAQNELIPFWYALNGGEWRANMGNGYFGTTAITTNSGNGYSGAEGASKFNYTVPTGYSALSTKGLNE